jgi:hypothetical protein
MPLPFIVYPSHHVEDQIMAGTVHTQLAALERTFLEAAVKPTTWTVEDAVRAHAHMFAAFGHEPPPRPQDVIAALSKRVYALEVVLAAHALQTDQKIKELEAELVSLQQLLKDHSSSLDKLIALKVDSIVAERIRDLEVAPSPSGSEASMSAGSSNASSPYSTPDFEPLDPAKSVFGGMDLDSPFSLEKPQ